MTASEPGAVGTRRVAGSEGRHFALSLLYAAAKMYYDEDATQAQVAMKLHVSRPTVSRLLSEARRQGIVRIEVIPPDHQGHDGLAEAVSQALGLHKVHISATLPGAGPGRSVEDVMGSVLAPAVGRALTEVSLRPGDVLLVSSGRTIYEVARFDLPKLAGVVVAPTVGGTDQPEGWYQTNEITRRIAERIGGRATYLFAPALPGPDLYQTLQNDPAIQRVLHLWPQARCVLTGVGAPPLLRSAAPQFVDTSSTDLAEAVGDICSRFFAADGQPVVFPGSERLIAVELAMLQTIPVVIAVASGPDKIAPLIAGARSGFFTQLVTDPQTAELIIAQA